MTLQNKLLKTSEKAEKKDIYKETNVLESNKQKDKEHIKFLTENTREINEITWLKYLENKNCQPIK